MANSLSERAELFLWKILKEDCENLIILSIHLKFSMNFTPSKKQYASVGTDKQTGSSEGFPMTLCLKSKEDLSSFRLNTATLPNIMMQFKLHSGMLLNYEQLKYDISPSVQTFLHIKF